MTWPVANPCGWVDPDDATVVCTLHAGHRPFRPGWKGHVPPRVMLTKLARWVRPARG